MKFHKTKIEGLYVIEPELKTDERGYFARIFATEELAKEGLSFDVAQANISLTKKRGMVRGMHFQREPKSEGRIVQCVKGAMFDVAVDLRKNSKTFGSWVAEELTDENKLMLFIPKGFAHGFQALTDNCEVEYFMSELYSPEHAAGVRFDDPQIGVVWPLTVTLVSDRDKNLPLLRDLKI